MRLEEYNVEFGDLIQYEDGIYIYVGKRFSEIYESDFYLMLCVNSLKVYRFIGMFETACVITRFLDVI